jgi:hypothetical protein
MDTLTTDPTGAQFHDLTTLEVDTLTIDPKGAHDLQHPKWTHLKLTTQGLNSTTYYTRGGHTYN